MMQDYDYEMAQAAHDMQARLETDIATLVDERDSARRWSAAWKRAAKRNRAWQHTVAEIAARQIMEHAHCQEERDEARAVARHFYRRAGMLEDAGAALAADAVDAIKGRQEAERERDEYRDLYQQLDRHTHEDLVPELDWLRQRRDELERELREARKRNEALVSQRRLLAECFVEIGRIPEERFQKAMALALSIVEEDAG